jgi:release factor glutamine methyltransferase
VTTDAGIACGEVVVRATSYLRAHGSATPRLDAEVLLAHVLACDRLALYTSFDRPLIASERDAYRELIARRGRHEPVAYLVGSRGFRRLVLAVDERALIPRPDTEVVVERCLALLEGHDGPRVLDVGTGSGAIALAIADEHPAARVTGMDASSAALELARDNGRGTGVAIELEHRDLFDGLPPGPWDLIVSNPPYVDEADYESLMPDVRGYEPRSALVAGGETEAIAGEAASILAPGGALVLEVGEGQAPARVALLERLGFLSVRVTDDLAGVARVVEGRRA